MEEVNRIMSNKAGGKEGIKSPVCLRWAQGRSDHGRGGKTNWRGAENWERGCRLDRGAGKNRVTCASRPKGVQEFATEISGRSDESMREVHWVGAERERQRERENGLETRCHYDITYVYCFYSIFTVMVVDLELNKSENDNDNTEKEGKKEGRTKERIKWIKGRRKWEIASSSRKRMRKEKWKEKWRTRADSENKEGKGETSHKRWWNFAPDMPSCNHFMILLLTHSLYGFIASSSLDSACRVTTDQRGTESQRQPLPSAHAHPSERGNHDGEMNAKTTIKLHRKKKKINEKREWHNTSKRQLSDQLRTLTPFLETRTLGTEKSKVRKKKTKRRR